MLRIATRLCAARFRRPSPPSAPFRQTPQRIHSTPPWQRLSTGTSSFSSLLPSLGLVTFAAISSSTDARADAISNHESCVADEDELFIEETDKDIHEAGPISRLKYMLYMPVEVVYNILYDAMDAPTRNFFYAITATNVSVYSAFMLASSRLEKPNPKPNLLRFLSRNFLLSVGWLQRHRWHVILTNVITHVSFRHLFQNTGVLFGLVFACSRFLTGQEIAALFVTGGVVGSVVSVGLIKCLRKTKYLGAVHGSSDGLYALLSYYICAQDVELSALPWFPLSLFFKGMLLVALVREGTGLRKMLRHGATASDHAAHLAGALTGALAFGLSRASDEGAAESSVFDDVTETASEQGRTGPTRESKSSR